MTNTTCTCPVPTLCVRQVGYASCSPDVTPERIEALDREATNEGFGTTVQYVPGHGTFRAPVLVYLARKRQSRAVLTKLLLQIYEGSDAHGGQGSKASHWRGYHKQMLAIIVADCLGAP